MEMAVPVTPSPRNSALDNLRVVAMLLGLVTHGVLPFKATGIGRYPIRDCHAHPLADACYFAVHDFRMQLFFLVAGYAAVALASRRGVGALLANRARRIVLPLLLAVAVVTPLMHLLFTVHAVDRDPGPVTAAAVAEELELAEWAGPNFHLWFLYYLALCAVPLAAALALGPKLTPGRVVRGGDAAFRGLLGRWWKTPALAAACVPVLWTMPDWWIDTPQGWVPRPFVLAYYLGFFLFGALLCRHRDLLPAFGRNWLLLLLVANAVVLPVMLKLTVSGNWMEDAAGGPAPAWLVGWKAAAIFVGALYTWLMAEGLIGLFQRHFAGSSGWWAYLAEASYWCYLAGFPVQVALQVGLAEHPLPLAAKFVLVNAVTFALLLLSYELLVRHSWLGLLLNGRRPGRTAPPAPVVIATRVEVPGRRVTLPRREGVPVGEHA